MSDSMFGVVYDRYGDLEGELSAEDVCWFGSEREAVTEFNERGDKYAASRLVRARITDLEVLHPGVVPGSQWDDDYKQFYYERGEDV